jgi:hypothetical protein
VPGDGSERNDQCAVPVCPVLVGGGQAGMPINLVAEPKGEFLARLATAGLPLPSRRCRAAQSGTCAHRSNSRLPTSSKPPAVVEK